MNDQNQKIHARTQRSLEILGIPNGNLDAFIREDRAQYWKEVVTAYLAQQDSIYHAWEYINCHPIFQKPEHKATVPIGWATGAVEFHPVIVNPATNEIDEDPTLNTLTQWWFEFGPVLDNGEMGHHWDLDVTADSYEEGVLELARLIHEHYGDDRSRIPEHWERESE